MSHGHHGGGGGGFSSGNFGGGHHHHNNVGGFSSGNFGSGHHHHHHHRQEFRPISPIGFGYGPRRRIYWGAPFNWWGFGRPYGFYRPRYYHYRRGGCGVFTLAIVLLFALLLVHLWWLILPLAFLAIIGGIFMASANRNKIPTMNQQQYPNQGYNQPYQQQYPNQPPYQGQPNNPYGPNQGYPY